MNASSRLRARLVVAVALACGVLIAACVDRPLAPSGAGSDPMHMNVAWAISKELSTVARSVEIQVGYDLPSGAFVKLADDSFSVSGSSAQLPLTVNLSPCLSDPNRGATSNVCAVVALVSLRDATGATIATASAGPINATPGAALTALTVAVDAVAAVSVTPPTPTIPVGATAQLTATETDSGGAVLSGRAVTWTSSNPGVATVSATGLVAGVSAGVDTIKATSEDQIGVASVTTTVRYANVSLGRDHACGLTNTGTLYCWGYDGYGQLGVGANGLLLNPAEPFLPTPTVVAGGHTFAQVAAGDFYSCALTSAGAAFCWGINSRGQLGTGDTLSRSVPTAVNGGIAFTSLSSGGTSGNGTAGTCGLTPEGSAYCWGYVLPNTSTGISDSSLAAVLVPGGLSFRQLTSGLSYACGLTMAGVAYCWGFGQFGNGSLTSSGLTPVLAAGGMVFKKIAAGDAYTCGLTSAGAAYCWGGGILGDGTTLGSSVPVAVSGGLVFSDINAGNSDGVGVCGVIVGGAAYCWGGNTAGGLGDGTTTTRLVPTAVNGGISFTRVIPSRFRFTCGISTSGTVYCWGYNAFGQLGNGGYDVGTSVADSYVPVRVIWQP